MKKSHMEPSGNMYEDEAGDDVMMAQPAGPNCPACGKPHYDKPCRDKTIPLSKRMQTVMLIDGDRGGDYWDLPLARNWVAEVRAMEKSMRGLQADAAMLKDVCAEAYQLAGVVAAPVAALDNLSDAAQGVPLRHETFLPVLDTDCEVVAELIAMNLQLLEALGRILIAENGACRLCGFLDSQEGHVMSCPVLRKRRGPAKPRSPGQTRVDD